MDDSEIKVEIYNLDKTYLFSNKKYILNQQSLPIFKEILNQYLIEKSSIFNTEIFNIYKRIPQYLKKKSLENTKEIVSI